MTAQLIAAIAVAAIAVATVAALVYGRLQQVRARSLGRAVTDLRKQLATADGRVRALNRRAASSLLRLLASAMEDAPEGGDR